MPLNQDEKKEIREQKEEIERKIHRSACFQRIFRGPDGELAIEAIDEWSGHKNDTFDADPYVSAYNAGKRATAIFIHNVIEGDIEEARRLLKDAEGQER